MKSLVSSNNKVFLMQILKGSLASLSISLVGILLFALLIHFTGLSDGFIMPINQVIKIVSIFVGVFLALKTNKMQGFIKGLLIGLIYTFLAYVLFSILSSTVSVGITSLNDLLFGGLIGGISGIISVNIKK